MVLNDNKFFSSIVDELTLLNSIPEEESEEEKRKREEQEKLEVMQESLQKEKTIKPVKSKNQFANVPASREEEKFFNNIVSELKKVDEEDEDYTILDGISTTRRIQYGAAQEPTIAGSTFRLLKA